MGRGGPTHSFSRATWLTVSNESCSRRGKSVCTFLRRGNRRTWSWYLPRFDCVAPESVYGIHVVGLVRVRFVFFVCSWLFWTDLRSLGAGKSLPKDVPNFVVSVPQCFARLFSQEFPQPVVGIVQKVFSEKASATARMRQKCVRNASKMRQKCVKMGLVYWQKRNVQNASEIRQKSVKTASKMRGTPLAVET